MRIGEPVARSTNSLGRTCAVAVDIVAQPAMQRAEFAVGNFVRNFRMGLQRRGIKLRRQNIADGVALKPAADEAAVPVHVLQAAVAIVGRRDAEIGFHARAPRLRQILHRELAFQHFQLESKRSMMWRL